MASLAYRIECTRRTLGTRRHLSEWHTSLGSALEAFLEQQQGPWNSVALVPQVAQEPHQEQMGLALQEEA